MTITYVYDGLIGIGLREQDQFTGYDRLSMMGGARLLVRANGGLNEKAGSNLMTYQNYQVDDLPTIYGPALTRKLITLSGLLAPLSYNR
jgi:hypothetical protein